MADGITRLWAILLLLLVALILAVVGFATPNWYRAVVNNSVAFTAGLFDVCVSSSCFDYVTYLRLSQYSRDYVGCIVFHVFGITFGTCACLLALCGVYRSCAGCTGVTCRTLRKRLVYVAWITLLAGVCLLVAIIWFYVAVIRNENGKGNLAGTYNMKVDYSYALSATSAIMFVLLPLLILWLVQSIPAKENYHYYDNRSLKVLVTECNRPPQQSLQSVPYETPTQPIYTLEQPALEPVRMSTSIRAPEPTYVSSRTRSPEAFVASRSYRVKEDDPVYVASRSYRVKEDDPVYVASRSYHVKEDDPAYQYGTSR